MITINNRGDSDSQAIAYRPDIDGMRAIAVLAVVAYHINKDALPGGYLGVDMFFVISGFLITSIIWREMQGREFTIRRFYERRIRRILPALFALLAVTSALAFLFLLPADLIGYGKSQFSTLAFVANIYFWRDTDYFSRLAETKPLLHLWSLSVEEQFYILFPPFLLLVGRFWRGGVIPVVIGLVALSLGGQVFAQYIGGNAPAFYMLPTRAWELGLGAVPALLPAEFKLERRVSEIAAALGGALVLWSLIMPLDKLTLWPPAAVTVAGSALMIAAGIRNMPLAARALSWRPIVLVGLISYSLYLWHWPVLVYAKYFLVRDLSLIEILAALGVMFALATLSWRYVERPFRSRRIPIRTVLICAAACAIVLGAFAFALVRGGGFPERLNPAAARINESVSLNYRCSVDEFLRVGAMRGCVMNLPSRDPDQAEVVLFGNSHAQMFAPAFPPLLAARGVQGLLLPQSGCLPTLTINDYGNCYDVARRNLTDLLALKRVRIVVIGPSYMNDLQDRHDKIIPDPGHKLLIAGLDDLIDHLRAAGKTVILIGPYPQPGYDLATVLSRKLAFGWPTDQDPTFESFAAFQADFGGLIRHFEARRDIGFVRVDTVQLRGNRYEFILDGHALYADDNHIAVPEIARYRPIFKAALDTALAKP
jgi:peptidoglycan/LPS O-acetylase OafA/YrhL